MGRVLKVVVTVVSLGITVGEILSGDEEWHIGADNIDHEIKLVKARAKGGDHYPQKNGSEGVLAFLYKCKAQRIGFRMVAKKKLFSRWAWYFCPIDGYVD